MVSQGFRLLGCPFFSSRTVSQVAGGLLKLFQARKQACWLLKLTCAKRCTLGIFRARCCPQRHLAEVDSKNLTNIFRFFELFCARCLWGQEDATKLRNIIKLVGRWSGKRSLHVYGIYKCPPSQSVKNVDYGMTTSVSSHCALSILSPRFGRTDRHVIQYLAQ